jgi:drug/metabolite transporter (DMT)-like permease
LQAVLLAVVSSLFFGVGTALQKQGMSASFPRITLQGFIRQLPQVLRTLLVNRAWVLGIALQLGGGALFGMALGRGDITVVQPIIGLTGAVTAVIGVGLLGERLGRLEWAGIATTLLGVALVGLASGGQTSVQPEPLPLAAFLAAVSGLALASLLLTRIGLTAELTLALAAGLFFGLANMLGKLLTQRALAEVGGSFDLHRPELWSSMLSDWPLWAIIAANVAAGVFYQTAFANGRASVVGPVVVIVSNVLPICGALLLFAERPQTFQIVGIIVVVVGAALLALQAQGDQSLPPPPDSPELP